MAEKNTFSSIQEGLESTNRSSDGESLMKGRTYISRLSPDTRDALVKALRERRKKKTDEKMASRKSASDDYFASEADKALYNKQDKSLESIMDAELEEDFNSTQDKQLSKEIEMRPKRREDVIEDRLKKLSSEQETKFKKGGKTPKYKYGGKTKKYRK